MLIVLRTVDSLINNKVGVEVMPSSLKDEILSMNERRSREFRDSIDVRRDFRRYHPTEFVATMCMDGRVNVAYNCNLPFGMFTVFRNIGGRFNLGWPMMRLTLNELERYAYRKRRPVLLVITYHWSEGDPHRGCAGFEYQTQEAMKSMRQFRSQVDHCYGSRINTVLVGVETDSDALIVHGEENTMLDMRQLAATAPTAAAMEARLCELLPRLSPVVLADFATLLVGNARHIQQAHAESRGLSDYKHRERVLAVGQGFDWLTERNFALIIGPCDPVLDGPITTAAKIIRSNWKEGRIPEGGVLLVSTPFRKPEDRTGATMQSLYLAELGQRCIAERLPDMASFFHPLVGVLDLETRAFMPC